MLPSPVPAVDDRPLTHVPTALMHEHARALGGSDLPSLVAETDRPVVVEFWDPRCSSCRAVLDDVDGLACRLDGRAVVATLNVREHTEVAREAGIEMLPTMVVFRDGSPAHTLVGAQKIQAFSDRIEEELFNGAAMDC